MALTGDGDGSATAVVSDVHGNRWALEAVMEDLERRGIERVLNLGDSLFGPLDPAGTAELLPGIASVNVRGNQDRAILEAEEERPGPGTLRFACDALSADAWEWLRGHEVAPIRVGELTLCHGTPQRDDRCLVEWITEHGVELKATDALDRELEGIEGEVVLCGHSHVPRLVGLPDGRAVVNPGSVGLPAYTGEAPYPHAMESGSPHARYAVLERLDGGWKVEHVAVPYDWGAAAAAAERNGRADWAGWLRTGRAEA